MLKLKYSDRAKMIFTPFDNSYFLISIWKELKTCYEELARSKVLY